MTSTVGDTKEIGETPIAATPLETITVAMQPWPSDRVCGWGSESSPYKKLNLRD